jgi:hypothetical protein
MRTSPERCRRRDAAGVEASVDAVFGPVNPMFQAFAALYREAELHVAIGDQ